MVTEQRITTEEAERIAARLEYEHDYYGRIADAAALRALAAERDRLREEIGWLRIELSDAQRKGRESYSQGYAAGSGENQP